jgi:hypothetical protein
MEIYTKAEVEKIVSNLESKITELRSMIIPFVQAQREGNKVLTKEQAAKHCRLGLHGLSEARRKGRIKAVKINAKEYGYRLEDCNQYLERYQK